MDYCEIHTNNIVDYFALSGICVYLNYTIEPDGAIESVFCIENSRSDINKWKNMSRALEKNGYRFKLLVEGLDVKFYFRFSGISDYTKFLYILFVLARKRYYEVEPVSGHMCLLVKPTHGCNLDCQYCYDRRFAEIIKTTMSFETVEILLEKVSRFATSVEWIWHGGEPTLMGIKWYEHIYDCIVPKYPMLDISFSMMSNGIKLNKSWKLHAEKYNVHIGMSYNYGCQGIVRGGGVADLSSCLSFDAEESLRLPSNVNLINTLREFNSYGAKIGVIDVVTKDNCERQWETYNFYKSLGVSVSLNPVFHTDRTLKNGLEADAKFLTDAFMRYFNNWLYDISGYPEREAEELIRIVCGGGSQCCKQTDCRYRWLSVNPIGDLYPCDRYLSDKYIVGNILADKTILDVFSGESYINYSNEVASRINNNCSDCGYVYFCNGGCNCVAFEATGSISGVDEGSCELFRQKFKAGYNILKNVSIYDPNLNPYARKALIASNFYSLPEITAFLSDNDINIELEYNDEDFLNCSEFSFFSSINFRKKMYRKLGDILNCNDINTSDTFEKFMIDSKVSSEYRAVIHSDFYVTDEVEFIEQTREKRKTDLGLLICTIIKEIQNRVR